MSLDSDTIIHPRNQGVSNDAEFVETWAERKAARAVEPKLARKRMGPLPAIHTDEQVSNFRRLYAFGSTERQLADEFSINPETVRRTARRLGLRRKREITRDDDHLVPVTAHITLRDYLRLKKKCGRRLGKMGSFLRSAIIYKLDGAL